MNIFGNGGVGEGANIGKTYAAALWSFASERDMRILRCLHPVTDFDPVTVERRGKIETVFCHNHVAIGDAAWESVPLLKVDGDFSDFLTSCNYFFTRDGGSWISSSLCNIEMTVEVRALDREGNVVEKDRNEVKDLGFIHLKMAGGDTFGLVNLEVLHSNANVVFDGVPYIKAYEGVEGLPDVFVYPDCSAPQAVGAHLLDEGVPKILRSESHVEVANYRTYHIKKGVWRVNPIAKIFTMGRCFVDSLGSSFLTAGGNALQDGLSANFVDAMNRTNHGDGIFLYAPKTYASTQRVAIKGAGDALSALALDNLVDGTVFVVTHNTSGQFKFLSECSIAITSRNPAAKDRNTLFYLVDARAGLCYGHKGIFNFRTGTSTFYNKEKGFDAPFKLGGGDTTRIVFTPGAREGRKTTHGVKSVGYRSR